MSRGYLTVSDSIAGPVIDPLEFARKGGRLEREVGLHELPRLIDVLSTTAGSLSVLLVGWRDEEGGSWLQLDIAGEPDLLCQRCLGGVKFPLLVSSRLQLIAPGGVWPDDELEEDGFDAIDAGQELAVLSLIEDEVLLALPIAPRHEKCDSPLASASEHGSSPFSALAALKKH